MFERTKYSPKYDYSKLRGRIKEVLGTEGKFAEMLGRSHNYIVSVFKGDTYFDHKDIDRACCVLDIDFCDIGVYFFTQVVCETQTI